MKFNILIFAFAVAFVIVSSLAQTEPTDPNAQPSFLNHAFDTSLQKHYSFHKDNDMISLNVSHSVISKIGSDFIANPLITNLYLSNNHIQTIEKGAFRKLPNLTSLYLSNNDFMSDIFSFGSHAKLRILVMDNVTQPRQSSYQSSYRSYYPVRPVRPVSTTPSLILPKIQEYPNLEILSLHNNSITRLQYISQSALCDSNSRYDCLRTSPLPKLKFLDLSRNKLKTTEFMELLSNTLLYLDLDSNQLDSIKLYKKGENLVLLNLDNNNLLGIGDSLNFHNHLELANLTNLSYLSVSNNRISHVLADAFKDTGNLIYLNLSRNAIKNLYSEMFATLQLLRTLDLSYNQLENAPEVPSEIQVRILFLHHNAIRKIESNTFMRMPNLTKLLLGRNHIDSIEKEAFADLSNLEELDLSENWLWHLPEGWSEGLVSLKYLDLSDNNFISLETVSLAGAIPLTELGLAANPLKYLSVGLASLPQNLTVHLVPNSNFTDRWLRTDPNFKNYISWLLKQLALL